MSVLRAIAVGAAAIVVLAGCAGMHRPEVERVAVEFATGTPAARCALLAPATLSMLKRTESAECGATIRDLAPSGGRVRHTEVWGENAQVRTADDTLFLTRTRAGWKVAAAGCSPNGDAPYQCRVDGP
jgi:hypothetical protein